MHSKQYFEEKIAELNRNRQYVGRKTVRHGRNVYFTFSGLTEGYKVYRSPDKDSAGFVVTKEPWRYARSLEEVKDGVIKSVPDGAFSAFDIGDGSYYVLPSTKEEKKLCGKSIGKMTGMITSQYKLFLSPLDFTEITGKLLKECEKSRDKMPWFVMRVKVSESESFIELSCPKRKPKGLKPMKKAFAEKYGKSFGYKANDSFDVTFLAKPAHNANFQIPIHFIRYLGIAAGDSLPTHYDKEKKKFIFEAPIKTCSCCGKPIHSIGENSTRGLVCKNCSETLPALQSFVVEHVGGSTEKIMRAAEIIAKSGLYGEFQKEIETMLKRTEER